MDGAPKLDTKSAIWFLSEKGLYKQTKPYFLAFTPEGQIPRHNIERHEVAVTLRDIRGARGPFSLDHNGFMLLEFERQQAAINWYIDSQVKSRHYPDVILHVERAVPKSRCIPLHHRIRKRDPAFPSSTGKDYQYGQPLVASHVDLTCSSAEQLIQEELGSQGLDILSRRYIIANVWHPIKGPNQDWPLALCDVSTVNPETDLEVADYVTSTTSREHCMLYARERQCWWYMSNQLVTEAFLFRQHDSAKGDKSGVPHAAFFNPYPGEEVPRESIEIVVLVYFP